MEIDVLRDSYSVTAFVGGQVGWGEVWDGEGREGEGRGGKEGGGETSAGVGGRGRVAEGEGRVKVFWGGGGAKRWCGVEMGLCCVG